MVVRGWHPGTATDVCSAWIWTSARLAFSVSSDSPLHYSYNVVLIVCWIRTLKWCFEPGGAKPEGHEDDHEMVNMEYACDHCQGLIVGSRINCNVCEDFDLCFGCYHAKKYPDR